MTNDRLDDIICACYVLGFLSVVFAFMIGTIYLSGRPFCSETVNRANLQAIANGTGQHFTGTFTLLDGCNVTETQDKP